MSNKIFVFFFVLLSISNILLCQTDTTTNFDNSYENNKIGKYKLRLDGYQKHQSPLLYLRSAPKIDLQTNFIIPTLNQHVLEENLSRLKLREDINSAMMIYRKGLIKNDLGVVGDILGYTNAAAAIGLAIYHVSKHKRQYGIK